ncbi:hypothetical protein Ahy_B03g063152 isoform B [Arachis hypogaea]|uniref:Uncharacterized protein n=1 Tax=Arachis hypogaea TaxID=3818 RepID=A0A444ZWT8_ARAHY|nr:hypothetical protein Ahy_B03g063152 isoform B [Arachis hypogaea]
MRIIAIAMGVNSDGDNIMLTFTKLLIINDIQQFFAASDHLPKLEFSNQQPLQPHSSENELFTISSTRQKNDLVFLLLRIKV